VDAGCLWFGEYGKCWVFRLLAVLLGVIASTDYICSMALSVMDKGLSRQCAVFNRVHTSNAADLLSINHVLMS
jgi:hypothetical protein